MRPGLANGQKKSCLEMGVGGKEAGVGGLFHGPGTRSKEWD